MKYLFFLLLVCPLLGTNAQAVGVVNEPMDMIVYLVNLNNTGYADVEGSPYAEEEFRPVTIAGEEKTRFIRLNIADDIVEVQEEGKVMQLRLRENIRMTFQNAPKKELVIRLANDGQGNARLGVFEKIQEIDGQTLYLKSRKKYIPKKEKEAFQESAKARFIPIPDAYYISDFQSNTAQLLELPRKKKAFMALFGGHKGAVEKFVKKERLDFKDPDDLVKIFTFFFGNQMG